MARPVRTVVGGVDAGTECIKVVVVAAGGTILGRAVVPTGGYFQDRIAEALGAALDEAGVADAELAALVATGFAARCTPGSSKTVSETAALARGAFHHRPRPMTIVDVGGRDPRVIRVDGAGGWTERRTVRKCAVGIGTFLMYAARHLDIHPTRMMELASAAERPAAIGSYCSVFAENDILERLRNGSTREEVALGCLHSVAERILEIGGFEAPVYVTGGVPEYFPGVLDALAAAADARIDIIPEPIVAGALGAALLALDEHVGS